LITRRRRDHEVLDLERGVPFLKLLMLERQGGLLTAAGAHDNVMADKRVERSGRIWFFGDLPVRNQSVTDQ
jgi:hypothetical protein